MIRTCTIALTLLLASTNGFAQDDWVELFDGKTLKNWDGDPTLWSVEEGTIMGRTTAETNLKVNNFLIYRGGEFDNFELQFDYKIIDGNSGVQYRSFELPEGKWRLGGYQADFEAKDKYSGILYGEKFRGILALRGESTELTTKDGKMVKTQIEQFGNTDEIQTKIKKEDWNSYKVIANGNRFQHFINDTKTSECLDNDDERRATGLLGLQIHVGPPMTVQFRKIRIKKLF
jgi:hypothetical protein